MQQKQWEELLAEYETSGLSINAWCKRKEIAQTTFMNWRRMYRMSLPPAESHINTKSVSRSGAIKIQRAGWEINIRCPVDMDDLEKVLQLVAAHSG